MTLVLDASACAEYLLGTRLGLKVAAALKGEDLHAPHLLVNECSSVLRRWNLGGEIHDDRARVALGDLAALQVHLWDSTPLLGAIWQRRHNLTAYDATYVALAAWMGVGLLTTDRRLAAAAPETCRLVHA